MTMTEPAVDLATDPATELEQSSVDGPGAVAGDEQVVSSITLEDGSSYLLVDPTELIIGPNVRTEANLAKGFTSFAQDIGQRGVKAPIRAHRNTNDELVVIEGQMRVLAALEKGTKKVRVLVEPQPAGDETEQEIERIIGQLNDNHHRTANTQADEVRATQQLLELGVTARALERRRSIPRRYAQNLVAVARSVAGSRSVTDGIADLAQAAVFVEFDGDEDALTALTECLRKDPERFDHVAQRLRDDREETRLRAEATARLVEQGVSVIDEPDTYGGPIRPLSELRASAKTQPGTRLTPSRHAKCPGHAAYLDYSSRRPVDKRVEVVYVCTDYRAHEHPLLWQSSSTPASVVGTGQRGGKMTEEQKAARRTVIANGKAWDSATTVRRAWLTGFARKTPPKDATQWRTRMEAEGSPALQAALEKDHPLATELLGLGEKEGRSRYQRSVSHPIADAAATATRARAEMLSLIMLLAAIEDTTDRRRTWETPTREQRDYFAQLAAWGYPLEAVEQLVLGDSQPAASSPAIEAATDTQVGIAEPVEESGVGEHSPHHQDGAAEVGADEHVPLAA
jgi:ParB family chromosome partitioning protein